MAYTAPTTRATSDLITAAIWNADVIENIRFLANPPACRVYHNANQSIAAGTETTLAFNTERVDTNAMHDTVTNNSRITFATAGLYVVTATLEWAAGAGAWTNYATLRVDGATVIAKEQRTSANTLGSSLTISTVYKFNATQYVEVRVWQNSGALNVLSGGNYTPEFAAVWVGLG